jgi:hypothetical protein
LYAERAITHFAGLDPASCDPAIRAAPEAPGPSGVALLFLFLFLFGSFRSEVFMNLHTHFQHSRARLKPQAQVGIGSTITIRDVHTDEREIYTLVRPEEADIDRNRLSSFSPLGKALGGRQVREVVDIDAPGGVVRYEIEAVLGFAEDPQATLVEAAGESV